MSTDDMDIFDVITERNSHRLVHRKKLLDGVTCPGHGPASMLMDYKMKIVGYRDDVYGLMCPLCRTKAFAVREKG